MLIDLECRNCHSDTEVDTELLIEDGGSIKCGNCRTKLDAKASEQFASTLDELVAHLDLLRKKFSFSITLDSDDVELFEEAEAEEEAEDWEDDAELDEESFDEDL